MTAVMHDSRQQKSGLEDTTGFYSNGRAGCMTTPMHYNNVVRYDTSAVHPSFDVRPSAPQVVGYALRVKLSTPPLRQPSILSFYICPLYIALTVQTSFAAPLTQLAPFGRVR